MLISREAMAPYYRKNKLIWDDQARLDFAAQCETYMLWSRGGESNA